MEAFIEADLVIVKPKIWETQVKFDVQDSVNTTMDPQVQAIDEAITNIQNRKTVLDKKYADVYDNMLKLAKSYSKLKDERADLKANGIKARTAVIQQTATIKLTGKELLAFKKTSDCSQAGKIADYLAVVDQVNTRLNQLIEEADDKTKQLGLVKNNLGLITVDGNLSINANKLTKVNELVILFTREEQQSMVRRLAESRARTVDLTYEVSKKLLSQNRIDIEGRPYRKGQTAKERKSETAALVGGLSYFETTARKLHQETRLDVTSSGYGSENNIRPSRSSLDGLGADYIPI
jgi:hypothetical protein